MATLELDAAPTVERLTLFLRETFATEGFARAVVGLSGGVDSAVSAALAARALGSENVWAILMPYRTSDPRSLEDARSVAAHTGVHEITEELSPQIDAYFDGRAEADPVRRGNKMARERMAILYDHSQTLGALVVGTGNRTEHLLGYTTQYGDNACAVNPLAPLYKCQVRQVARELGIPDAVIEKPPSADLWEGQTDEDELGLTYEDADPLLHAMFDRHLDRAGLIAEGFDADLIDRVSRIHGRTAFKRRLPLAATL